MTLTTSRLILRPMCLEDAPTIVRWRNSARIKKTNYVESEKEITIESHRQWFLATRDSRVDYIICLRNHFAIGSVSFKFLSRDDGVVIGELGKYIGEDSELAKGYGFEACLEWIRYGFTALRFQKIVSKTLRINSSNIRLNKKLGLHAMPWDTILGDGSESWLYMEITRDQWIDLKDVM